MATSLLPNALLTLADWFPPEVAVSTLAGAELTVKDVDVPLMPPEVILSVVLWAS